MKIKPILFNIPFPIELFKENKINIAEKKQREKLLKRNIYYCLYKNKKNNLLEQRWKIFFDLATKVREYLAKGYEKNNILSISIFGSALHSINNDDYDFLVIVSGSIFDNVQTKIKLDKIEYSVGISLKGEENFSKGVINRKSRFNKEIQDKIINRTSISLPYRHLPILGLDFKENREIFLSNCYAQIYDLLINSYNAYYLRKSNNKMPNRTRARKILSRIFEASKYASLVFPTKELENIQRRIVSRRLGKKYNLRETKKLFIEFVNYYNKLLESN
ncbi:hypothetical protein J4461_00550 [Candidatus Pacearchaeota archaeon]|nr:hypothetical protein [Candidatus Pacearchaeota archaeon]